MDLLLHSIQLDWPVLTPIFLCSIMTIAVAIDRAAFYHANKKEVQDFVRRLQRELSANNLIGAQNVAEQCGGVIGEVTEEAVRILSEQNKKSFSRSFDIAAALATRKLEHRLTILGTIGGVAPFLGLFGTVLEFCTLSKIWLLKETNLQRLLWVSVQHLSPQHSVLVLLSLQLSATTLSNLLLKALKTISN